MGPEDCAAQGICDLCLFFLLGQTSVKSSCPPVEDILLVFPPGSPVPNVPLELYFWFGSSFFLQLDLAAPDSLIPFGFWFFSVVYLLYVGLLF